MGLEYEMKKKMARDKVAGVYQSGQNRLYYSDNDPQISVAYHKDCFLPTVACPLRISGSSAYFIFIPEEGWNNLCMEHYWSYERGKVN